MMTLEKVKDAVCGFLSGPDVLVHSVSIDTRTLNRGALFVAIKGQHFDGHDFVSKAAHSGAAAAIVNQDMETDIPLIIVDDTKEALRRLGAYWRQHFEIPLVGVTGSCGKTTVRAMLQSILSQKGSTLASEKSYNNEIGVPLTLLQLKPEHRYAVIEMGMNNPGEIEILTRISDPDVAVITCVAPVHLEALKTLENIAKAKAEIYEGLNPQGTAVINNDDDFADFFKEEAKEFRQIMFGMKKPSDVSATNIQLDAAYRPAFVLHTPSGRADVQLPTMGKHNVHNAMAAAAAAIALEVSIEEIKVGLESMALVERRLNEGKGCRGATVIDDSYNANPASMSAAIDILASRGEESVLVFGDMLELGEQAEAFHKAVGEKAHAAGIRHLYCFGKLARFAAQAFGAQAQHFEDQAALIEALRSNLNPHSVVLIKGSNGMKMNTIVKALIQ